MTVKNGQIVLMKQVSRIDGLRKVGTQIPTSVYEHYIMMSFLDSKNTLDFIRLTLIENVKKVDTKVILAEKIAVLLWHKWDKFRYMNSGKLNWIREGSELLHFEDFLEKQEILLIKKKIPIRHVDAIIEKLRDLYSVSTKDDDLEG